MRILNAALYLVAVTAMAYVNTASASRCDAYFPFDGSLADATGNGHDGLMIAEGGAAAAPAFGEGRYGQALHITGKSAMRSFLDLHHEICPQFTITAWFKLPSVNAEGAKAILSTGAAGANPALVASGTSLRLYGKGNGLTQRDAIRDGSTWYFVAATFDYDAREYKLHWRNRSVDGSLSETPYDAEDSLWIGTRSDDFKYVPPDLYIDDVRVFGRVLGTDEIRDISRSDAPGGGVAPSSTQPAAGGRSGLTPGSEIPQGVGPGNATRPGIDAGELDRINQPPDFSGDAPQTAAVDAGLQGPVSSAPVLSGPEDMPGQPLEPTPNVPGTVPVSEDTGSGPTVTPAPTTDPAPIPFGGGSGDPARGNLEDAAGVPAPLQAMETEPLDCRIDTDRTLRNRAAAVDYSADCVVDVTAALTIEPGVVIEFEEHAGLGIFDNGTIRARGTATQPVVLQATSSARGWWRGVFVGTRSQTNVLEHVRIEGAGSNYVYCCREEASLVLENAQIALSNVQLSNGGALGILADGNTEFTRYSGIRISSHDGYPARLDWRVLASLDGTGSDYSGNAEDFVLLSTDPITSATTLHRLNVPYLLPGEVVDVKAPLAIDAGVEMAVMENGGLGAFDGGTLTAEGTATDPIVWRGAAAMRGYWRGLYVETNSSSNRLRHVEIHHAGSNYVYCCDEFAALVVRDGRMSLQNSTITESGGCAVYVRQSANFSESGNTFSSNQGGNDCYLANTPVAAQDVPEGSCMTGEVRLFSGNFAPRGWALANGEVLDTQIYSELFSIIGTAYGGDGQVSFALPNVQPPASETAGTAAMICVNGDYPARS